MTPAEVAAVDAMRELLQQMAEVITINRQPDRWCSTMPAVRAATSSTARPPRSRSRRGGRKPSRGGTRPTLRQEFSTADSKLTQTWDVDKDGRLVLDREGGEPALDRRPIRRLCSTGALALAAYRPGTLVGAKRHAAPLDRHGELLGRSALGRRGCRRRHTGFSAPCDPLEPDGTIPVGDDTSRQPPVCLGPSPSTSLRFRFSSSSNDGLSIARVARRLRIGDRDHVERAAGSFASWSSTWCAGSVLCSSPPTVTATITGRDASRFSCSLAAWKMPFEQLAAVVRGRSRRQRTTASASFSTLGGVVDELLGLAHDGAQRHLGTALEALHELTRPERKMPVPLSSTMTAICIGACASSTFRTSRSLPSSLMVKSAATDRRPARRSPRSR